MDEIKKTQPSRPCWTKIKKHLFIDDSGTSKRQDIQSLRAVAITLVLAFHFMPKLFPNGYLGVDIFFVLSGYLMGLVLSCEKQIDSRTAVDFYYRRVKRIFPTFYLAVLLTLVVMFFVLSIPYIPDNGDSAITALTFSTNWVQLFRKNDYFLTQQVNELFKHSWSLSVEIQFYLVVPLLFGLLKNVVKERKVSTLTILSVLAAASWSYHLYLKAEPVQQFNDSFGRGWQFLLGILAYYVSFRKQKSVFTDETSGRSVLFLSLHVLFWVVLLFGFAPIRFHMFTARTLTTMVTAFYLVVGSYSQTILLSNCIFSYIGDISYSLYLTHWPCLILIQYSAPWHKKTMTYEKQSALALSIGSAVLIHHFFEKIHLKWEKSANMLLIAILFVTSFTVAYNAELLETPFLGPNEELIRSNMALVHPVYQQQEAVFQRFFGTRTSLRRFADGNGTLKVLVMGNSYALQHIHAIRKVLNGRYKSLHLLAMLGNQVISSRNNTKYREINRLSTVYLQPDVLIIATRQEAFQKVPVVPEDPLIEEGIDIMRNFSLHCKHILIGSPHPRFPRYFLNHFIDRLQRNLTVDNVHMNLDRVQAETSEAWKRTRAIVESCPKCQLVDTYNLFADYENNRILMFDPVKRLSYAENTIHFTNAGLEKMEGLYKKMLEPIIRKHERKTKIHPQKRIHYKLKESH